MEKIYENLKKNNKKYRKITSVMEFVVIFFIGVITIIQLVNGSFDIAKEIADEYNNTKRYDLVLNGNFRTMEEYERFKSTVENESIEEGSILRRSELILNEAKPNSIFPDMLDYQGDEKIYMQIYAIGEKEYNNYIGFLNLEYKDIKDKGIMINYTEENIPIDIFNRIVESGNIEGYLHNEKYVIPLGLLSHQIPLGVDSDYLSLIISDELYDKYFESRIKTEENGNMSYLDRNDRYFDIIDFQHEFEGIMSFDRSNLQIYYKATEGTDLEALKSSLENSLEGLRFRISSHIFDIKQVVNATFRVFLGMLVIGISVVLLIGLIIVLHIVKSDSRRNVDRILNKDLEKANQEYKIERNIYLILGLKILVTSVLFSLVLTFAVTNDSVMFVLGSRFRVFIVAAAIMIAYIPVKIHFGSIKTFIAETVILLPLGVYAHLNSVKITLLDVLLPAIYICMVLLISMLYEKHLIFKACGKNQYKIDVYEKK